MDGQKHSGLFAIIAAKVLDVLKLFGLGLLIIVGGAILLLLAFVVLGKLIPCGEGFADRKLGEVFVLKKTLRCDYDIDWYEYTVKFHPEVNQTDFETWLHSIGYKQRSKGEKIWWCDSVGCMKLDDVGRPDGYMLLTLTR